MNEKTREFILQTLSASLGSIIGGIVTAYLLNRLWVRRAVERTGWYGWS